MTTTTQPVQHKPWCNDHTPDEDVSPTLCTGVLYTGADGAFVEVTQYDDGPQISLYSGHGSGENLPSGVARDLAAALVKAAGIVERAEGLSD